MNSLPDPYVAHLHALQHPLWPLKIDYVGDFTSTFLSARTASVTLKLLSPNFSSAPSLRLRRPSHSFLPAVNIITEAFTLVFGQCKAY